MSIFISIIVVAMYRANVDDAEVLRKELASVQRLMDELASAKEMERDVLQSRLDELQMEHEALKNKDYSVLNLINISFMS